MTTLLRGGRVLGPDGLHEAMVVDADVITWTGPEASAPATDTVVDLDGALVTPGFVDAHVHLAQTGASARSLDLGSTLSLAQALVELESHAARSAGPIVLGEGWDESRWHEGRPITAAEIDAACGDRLVYLGRVDGHSAVISSSLADRVPGVREADGWEPTGVVARDAHHLVSDTLSTMASEDDRRTDIRHALRRAATLGITHLHECASPHIGPFNDLRIIREVCAAEPSPAVVAYWGAWCGGGVDAEASGLHGFAGDLNVDGSIGSRTACLQQPYADADHPGHLYLEPAAVADHVRRCTEQGLQAGFHVIGDRGMATVVAGIAAAVDACGLDAVRAARHRLEHAEMIEPEQIRQLASWGVAVSAQPSFDAAWGGPGRLYDQRLGSTRMRGTNPLRAYTDAGVVLAFGSDSPVTPLDPWGGVAAAVRHQTPEHALGWAEAFTAHTRGGHRAAGDDSTGVLAAGCEASYAVWDWNGPTIDGIPVIEDDQRPVCRRTVVRGDIAFDAWR